MGGEELREMEIGMGMGKGLGGRSLRREEGGGGAEGVRFYPSGGGL